MLEQRGFRIVKQSRVYETKPVAMPGARDFLNLVVAADTRLSPVACLVEFRAVELALGRGRHRRNAPRTLDLDLLMYGRQVINRHGLTVPHPRMHERMFVLRPLADIAPGVVHPVLRRRVRTLVKTFVGRDQWKAR